MSHLFISEKFYSIQGEGFSTGVPAIFLRLSGCNILCQSENWVCDSIDVWRKGVKTAFEDVLTENEIVLLLNGAHLVLTGGEPLMHQKKIVEYFKFLSEKYSQYNFTNIFVEVETNGTIIPLAELRVIVTQWNCSPKLSNSGERFEKRHKKDALKAISYQKNSWFKFVISSKDDIQEIEDLFLGSQVIKHHQVILMPAGDTQELLEKNRLIVIEQCKRNLFRYSDRLHIVAWNKKTGV